MRNRFSRISSAEPARDVWLGDLLRSAVGEPPERDVDWTALARRIDGAVSASAVSAPWWSYAERWQRRALPIALAAGLLGGVALWRTAGSARDATRTFASLDAASSLAIGTSSAEAASTFAHTVTSTVDVASEWPE